MNENTKTIAFVVAGAALLVAAIVTRPSASISSSASDVGTTFFPDFHDPLAAKTLDILEVDDLGEPKEFKVTQVNGIWSIPSHENYPADAERQLAEAAASLMDLKKLSFVSDNKADQEVYGVVDPAGKDLTAGSTGIGKRVTLEDGNGKVLAQYIIGKADPKQTGVRYVRVPGQDRIYRTEMNVDKLSVAFGDWIEKDLLKMNVFDFKELVINDHSVDVLQQALIQRSHITLDFDSKDSKWNLVNLQQMTKKGWENVPLAADEELNTQKLNDLKNALKDLKIINVAHKPAGLSADLRAASDLSQDREAKQSLAQHGFYFAKVDGQIELYSNEGEVVAGTSDGVEYVIRFGDIAGRGESEKKDEADKKAGENKDEAKAEDESTGASRYVFVTARFNKDLIAKPQLETVPVAGPKAPKDGEKQEPATDPAEKAKIDKEDAAKEKEEEKESGATPAPEKKNDGGSKDGGGADEPKNDEPKNDEPKNDEPKEPSKDAPAADKKSDEKPADEKKADEKKADEKKADEKKADEKKAEKSEAELERERIEKDNKRKQDEYDDKVKGGEKRVKELNERFADWYYIISDATYRKIHLTRDDVVKKKEQPADEKKEGAAATEAPKP